MHSWYWPKYILYIGGDCLASRSEGYSQPRELIYSCTFMIYAHSSQRAGMIAKMPNHVPEDLFGKFGPHEWLFIGESLYHHKKPTKFNDLLCIDDLTPGQSVGLLVTANGQLHLFIDGKHCREIATGLPVDTPLWGAAGVQGKCTKIKSEIMSGESSGVVISPSQCVGEELD